MLEINWILDAPVSNSGRLKKRLEEIVNENSYKWNIILTNNPDELLAKSADIVISSDGWILERCSKWFNLSALMIEERISSVNIVEIE